MFPEDQKVPEDDVYNVLRGEDAALDGSGYFVNASCDYNARLLPRYDRKERRWIFRLHIFKEIPAGNEITIKYGLQYFTAKQQDCLCKKCRAQRSNEHLKRLRLEIRNLKKDQSN